MNYFSNYTNIEISNTKYYSLVESLEVSGIFYKSDNFANIELKPLWAWGKDQYGNISDPLLRVVSIPSVT